MKKLILVHNPSAAGTVLQFFRNVAWGEHIGISTSSDDYSHGPLPVTGTSHAFFRGRQAFWKALDLYDVDVAYDFDLSDDFQTLIKELRSVERAELWTTRCVQDVFYSIVLLHLLQLDGVDTSDITIRFIEGKDSHWGLGAVGVEDLAAMYEASAAASIDQELFSEAWRAVSNGSADAINGFINGRDPSLPVIQALAAYLLRFPEFNGGLGSIERALLGACPTTMKSSAYTVGNAMVSGEPQSDRVGDVFLFRKLIELAKVEADPWFKLEGDPSHMRSWPVQITKSGTEARRKYLVKVL